MSPPGYNNFCPLSKASEILEPRWTLLILSEMWAGSTRFNDIGRGVPGLSPTLLSKRLKDLEAQGMVDRKVEPKTGHVSYRTTQKASSLEPIVHALGQWAHENVDCNVSLASLDSRLLMWNMRRKIDLSCFPAKRNVVQFIFPDQTPERGNYWLIAKPGTNVDLCLTDPGFEVDLFVETELRTMTSVYMGYAPLEAVIKRGEIFLSGDAALAASIHQWMRLSSFAAA
jgi:DNA-binding HxlR family transcriptional regulator